MKSADDVVNLIAERIGYIYHHRALMYGGTPAGVEILLCCYHELWAEIVERQEAFRQVYGTIHEEQECNGHSFSGRCRASHPEATDEETVAYTVCQWRKISDRLGVPIPHRNIIQDLEQSFGPAVDWKF